MITRTQHESIEKLLIRLPITLRQKFARPHCPQFVHAHYGQTEMQILHRAVFEIGHAVDYDLDGNWEEFTTWTGLTDNEMDLIHQEMFELGWTPESSVF